MQTKSPLSLFLVKPFLFLPPSLPGFPKPIPGLAQCHFLRGASHTLSALSNTFICGASVVSAHFLPFFGKYELELMFPWLKGVYQGARNVGF